MDTGDAKHLICVSTRSVGRKSWIPVFAGITIRENDLKTNNKLSFLRNQKASTAVGYFE